MAHRQMKLASLKSAQRDGQLIIVDRALRRYVPVPHIAPTLQAALDSWDATEPKLRAAAIELELADPVRAQPFDARACAAPLPRAYQWLDGSAYLHHVELVRKARGAEMPASFRTDPLMYQGGSDALLGACDAAAFASEEHGIDLEAEVAVVTDDVPLGVTAAAAARHVKLIVLVNDWSLRNLVPGELAKGFGFLQSKPASAFSAIAATPDELADAWRDGKLHLPLVSHINGELLGRPNAGVDMSFSFYELLAHAARTRRLSAGTILGSGTVANRDPERGCSCLAERRTLEVLKYGAARTPFLKFGDRVRIEMLAENGASIFGALDQEVVRSRANA
ncbi:MAG TPA: fumarylacetoacetate hydrolase family protein [Steroidobacteraceae bacterium]